MQPFCPSFASLLLLQPSPTVSPGIIQCDSAFGGSVPAYVAPGKPHVVDQLLCGQIVIVLNIGNFFSASQYSERPHEYVKIQLAQKVGFVDARYVKVPYVSPQAPESMKDEKTESITNGQQKSMEDEDQKKWNLISKDKIKLRDEMLSKPLIVHGPRIFSANVTNHSEFPLSRLRLSVRLYDCPKSDNAKKEDYRHCEIIVEAQSRAVPVQIPAGQTRYIRVPMMFDSTPQIKGILRWRCWIAGVRAAE